MPPELRIDLSQPRRIHVVGAGGAGMSAYTAMLAELGHHVTGSDVREHARLERLRLLGVECAVPQRAENLAAQLDAVVVSSAVPDHNVEVRAAHARGIPVLRRAEVLAAMVALRRGLGIAGTHGKTTTSSMITLILRAAGRHPSFLIGSELNEVGANEALDTGDWLVVEADESDGTFLELRLEAAVVTNVDNDHLWFWGDLDRLRAAFATFVAGIDSLPVLCADDPFLAELATTRADVVTYGLGAGARYRAVDYVGGPDGSRFVLERDGTPLGELRLPVIGRHHAQNAAGAAAVTMELGCEFDAVRRALARFGGVARRFQHRGEIGGVAIVDDYALLPPEVNATIVAAHEAGYRRVVAVFQPFRYARTAVMWSEFADAFVGADQVVLTDVCGFHESPIPGITGELLVHAVLDAHPAQRVAYIPHRSDLAELVPRFARPGDVILTLGGGDITNLPDELLARRVPATDVDSLAPLAADLTARLPGRVATDAPFGALTTWRVGGPAAVLVRVETVDELVTLATALPRDVSRLVLGRGSNVLVADAGYRGVVVVLGSGFETVTVGEAIVTAGGATALPVLARQCAAAGRAGLGFYVGIPGSVGGAVRMNAGGHGRETVEVLLDATVVDLAGDDGPVVRAAAALDLSYRHSTLTDDDVVVAARFRVRPGDPEDLRAELRDVVRWRTEHQPGGANAGSVFRNPPGGAAARLIDVEAGLRGMRVGGAVVSDKHANFIQAEAGATAADVHQLLVLVRDRVEATTGVRLVPEVRRIGFEDS